MVSFMFPKAMTDLPISVNSLVNCTHNRNVL